MKSKAFIQDKLREMTNEFPYIIFQYQYDEYDETHIVEVFPLSEFDNNEPYKESEAELCYDFDKKFFPETLMFVSEDSLIRVNNPEAVFTNELNPNCYQGEESSPFNRELLIDRKNLIKPNNHRMKSLDYSIEGFNYSSTFQPNYKEEEISESTKNGNLAIAA